MGTRRDFRTADYLLAAAAHHVAHGSFAADS
jgi:hypothetical protein